MKFKTLLVGVAALLVAVAHAKPAFAPSESNSLGLASPEGVHGRAEQEVDNIPDPDTAIGPPNTCQNCEYVFSKCMGECGRSDSCRTWCRCDTGRTSKYCRNICKFPDCGKFAAEMPTVDNTEPQPRSLTRRQKGDPSKYICNAPWCKGSGADMPTVDDAEPKPRSLTPRQKGDPSQYICNAPWCRSSAAKVHEPQSRSLTPRQKLDPDKYPYQLCHQPWCKRSGADAPAVDNAGPQHHSLTRRQKGDPDVCVGCQAALRDCISRCGGGDSCRTWCGCDVGTLSKLCRSCNFPDCGSSYGAMPVAGNAAPDTPMP